MLFVCVWLVEIMGKNLVWVYGGSRILGKGSWGKGKDAWWVVTGSPKLL